MCCPCHQSQFLDNPADGLVTIPQIDLVPDGFTICGQVFEVTEESQILTRNYSVTESRLTSFAYNFCGDPLSSPNDKNDCITKCLVSKELDMTSMKAAVSYFGILFLNSPEETEEN